MWRLGLGSETYPERPGAPGCDYYMRTGVCGYGNRCRYNHPHYRATPLMPDQYGGPFSSLRTLLQRAYGPMQLSPGVVPIPGWSPYSAPVSPALSSTPQHAVWETSLYGVIQLSSTTPSFPVVYPSLSSPAAQHAVGATSLYGIIQLSSTNPSLPVVYPSLSSPTDVVRKEQTFPERPGKPECGYYLKTGDCVFGTSCKFHHPRDRVPSRANCVLSPIGLPLRPGVQRCTFYVQNGLGKFGSTCKFDHPSASSLADAPVAPYPERRLNSILRHETLCYL